jgi:hypothetical protein
METISRKDLTLAWLAGLIDGDGCISFQRMSETRRLKRTSSHLVPYITITSTCTLTYEYMVKLYKELEVPLHVSMKPNTNPERQKPVYIFKTHGLKRSKTLLPLIMPYLVTKKREAELVMEFIEIRERLFATKTHDPREEEISEELRQIKVRRNTVKNPQRLYARLR